MLVLLGRVGTSICSEEGAQDRVFALLVFLSEEWRLDRAPTAAAVGIWYPIVQVGTTIWWTVLPGGLGA